MGHVAVVLACLVRAAEDHILDESRIERRSLDDSAQHGGGHVVGADRRQRAAVTAHRSPHGGHDPRLAEGAGEVATHSSILHGTAGPPTSTGYGSASSVACAISSFEAETKKSTSSET